MKGSNEVKREVTSTDAPETGVPALVVKRPETCP